MQNVSTFFNQESVCNATLLILWELLKPAPWLDDCILIWESSLVTVGCLHLDAAVEDP